jgi:hypothetical protein
VDLDDRAGWHCQPPALPCVAAAIFLNQSEVSEAPSALVEANVPRLTRQWDYRPRKTIRARAALDSPNTETSDGFSPDPFRMDDSVWLNDNSLEGVAPTFINSPAEAEKPITKAFPQTADSVCTAHLVDDALFRGRTKVL